MRGTICGLILDQMLAHLATASCDRDERSERLDTERDKYTFPGLTDEWHDIMLFFLNHWGVSAAGGAAVPLVEDELLPAFQQWLGLDGKELVTFEASEEMTADFFGWLDWYIPQVWGPAEDIGRLAVCIHIGPEQHFAPEYADRALIAKRFPFPILFRFEPDVDWQAWVQRNGCVLGSSPSLFPDSLEPSISS